MTKNAEFIPFDLSTWEREEHFKYFHQQIKCKYNINANIDITHLLSMVHKLNLKFFPCFMYAIMRAVNQNREFRTCIKDGVVGYWSYSVPAYTLFHEDDKTFSDVWSDYHDDFKPFYEGIRSDMEMYKNIKGVKAKKNCPSNFCPISAVPWISFTDFSLDSYSEPNILVPLIKFGKYFEDRGKTMIPFSISVHHAAADGYHTSKLINDIQEWANRVEEWISKINQ